MATLSEEKERNRRLKAEAEVRRDFLNRNEERERLRRENKILARHGKESAATRIKKAFTQTASTSYRGLKPLGHSIKSYGEYLAGPETKEKEHYVERGYYLKKIGKNTYKKVPIRNKKVKHRRARKRYSSLGKSYFGETGSLFGQSSTHRSSGDIFRRTI